MILATKPIKKIFIAVITLAVIIGMAGVGSQKAKAQDNLSASIISNPLQANEYIKSKKALPLKNILHLLEEHYDVTFLYKGGLVANKMVENPEIQIGEKTGEQLSIIIDRLGLKLHRVNETSYIVLPKPFKGKFDKQMQTVTGTVTDASTGETLPGVNVVLKGTTTGTSTNSEGQYELDVPSLQDTLMFSFIGYQTQEVPINGRSQIDVELQSQAVTGEDVVVVSYGTQSEREVSGSISAVTSEDFQAQPVGQLGQKLQGKLTGVQVTQTTGIPGEGMDFRIRGSASISAGNDPLFVVDGNPIIGDISTINPSQIESITVLKDASASVLYGSRAANGVVIIETKKPVSGDLQVDYDVYTGFQQIPQWQIPDMMNAREFATFKKEIAEFRGQTVDPLFQDPDQFGKGTDWFDVLSKPAAITEHSLTMSTGSENFSLTGMAGYFRQDGVLAGSGFERFSFRINSKFQPNEKLTVVLNAAPTLKEDENFGRNEFDGLASIVNATLLTSPIEPAKNPDGSLTQTASSPGMFANPNFRNTAEVTDIDNDELQILGNLFAEYEFIDNLTFKTSLNIDKGDIRNFRFNPSTAGDLFVGLFRNPFGSLNEESYLSWVYENTLNYKEEIGDHNFDFLVGISAQKVRRDLSFINADDFPDNKIKTFDAANTINASTNVQKWSLFSYLSRFQYSYKDKYLLTASARRDGSSRFGKDNRWGNFPSVSVGWILSEEKFMPEIASISFLKFRGSYGTIGNFDIGNFTSLSSISTSNFAFNDNVANGRSIDNLADQSLGWEKNKEFNIGMDIRFLNDRIDFKWDFFRKKTTDLLFNVNVPQASGFSNIQTNIGAAKFWGHEFSLRTFNLQKNNLSWTTNFNISFTENRVLELAANEAQLITGPGSGLIGGSHLTVEGRPIGMLFGMIHEGVFDNQEEFDNSPKHTTSQVGTVKFRDVNGDGIITTDDATIIGDPHPDFTFGLTNRINYQNFDFSVSMSGAVGHDILRGAEQTLTNLDGVFNVLSSVKNRWKSPEDPGNGRFGSVAAGTTFLERDWWNTAMLKDGSYLSVDNITVGYRVPIANQNFVKSLRVYGSIQQVFTFTSYPGNPQVSASEASTGLGIDMSSFPVPRIFTAGANIRF